MQMEPGTSFQLRPHLADQEWQIAAVDELTGTTPHVSAPTPTPEQAAPRSCFDFTAVVKKLCIASFCQFSVTWLFSTTLVCVCVWIRDMQRHHVCVRVCGAWWTWPGKLMDIITTPRQLYAVRWGPSSAARQTQTDSQQRWSKVNIRVVLQLTCDVFRNMFNVHSSCRVLWRDSTGTVSWSRFDGGQRCTCSTHARWLSIIR